MIDKAKTKTGWVRSGDFLAALTLFFSSLLFFSDLLGGRYLLAERDLGPYFIPPRFFWVESIRRGDFPLWNPYQFSGHPFSANPQHGLLYPLNSLFLLLPFDLSFNAIIVLHFFLGGLFTYLFVRDLGVRPAGSLIAGLTFMLSGYLLSVHSLLSCLLSVVWTPLMMMFFRRAIARPGFKNEALTALFVTLSFLGGGIEIVYGNFFVLFFMTLFPISIQQKDGEWRRIWQGMRSLLLVSFVFLLLSAIQLIPFLELFLHSIRGRGIPYLEATTWSFAPKDILLFFLPDAYGYFLDMKKYWVSQCWFKTLYTGGLPFILSLVFFLAPHASLCLPGERDRVRGFGQGRKFFFSVMFFSLFLSLGLYNPLYPFVFKYVPFFNGIRYPVKFLYLFILLLSMTAGLGFERLTEFSKRNENGRLKNLLMMASLVSGLFLLFSIVGHQGIEDFLKLKGIDAPDFNHLSVNLYHVKRFLFYIALFSLLLRVGYEVGWKTWIKALLIFFLIADLFGNMGFYGKEKTADYFRKTKIAEILSSDKGAFRTFSTEKTISMDTPVVIASTSYLDHLRERHVPSMNLLSLLHDIWGIDVIRLKRVDDLYRALTHAPSISTTKLVDLYGAKYVISVTPIEKDPRFELIYSRLEGLQGKKKELLKQNTVKLYKNRRALPRGWLVNEFKVMEPSAILLRMTTKDFHPEKEVFLEEEPRWPSREPGQSYGKSPQSEKVDLISESNNRLQLHVSARKRCLLVLSDTHFPGWKAYVDGKEAKIYRANYTFRAVPMSPGTHAVEFVYDPLSFKLGAFITFLAAIGCLVLGWFIRR